MAIENKCDICHIDKHKIHMGKCDSCNREIYCCYDCAVTWWNGNSWDFTNPCITCLTD